MRRQAPLDKCFSCAPFSVFPPQLIADIKRGVLENEKWIRLYYIFPFIVLFYRVFLCFLFCVFFLCFVFFRFFFLSCLSSIRRGCFFFCCFACLVLFLFCFVLFNLFRLLVFCLFFFFYRHRCLFIDTIQIEIMYNPANSICHGTCETDREFEWLNEWKLL